MSYARIVDEMRESARKYIENGDYSKAEEIIDASEKIELIQNQWFNRVVFEYQMTSGLLAVIEAGRIKGGDSPPADACDYLAGDYPEDWTENIDNLCDDERP